MKAIITDKHEGEGVFPTFRAGAAVEHLEACDESTHWMACSIQEMTTYIPDIFVENDKLLYDYNPTELIAEKGDMVDVEKIVYEWLYVKAKDGTQGWIPAEKVVSTE